MRCSTLPPEGPRHCPCGHKHVSWSLPDDVVHCWDCNRKYSISESLGACKVSNDSQKEEADE
jgi:ribosomal protein S11